MGIADGDILESNLDKVKVSAINWRLLAASLSRNIQVKKRPRNRGYKRAFFNLDNRLSNIGIYFKKKFNKLKYGKLINCALNFIKKFSPQFF